jgi:dTDP-4-dehydrorhamnose reductase
VRNILVTGASGLVAPYLAKEASDFGTVWLASRSSEIMGGDLTCPSNVEKILQKACPDWVIHAAAMTDVDGCQRQPTQAYKVNSGIIRNLVKQLPASTSLLILSTDQVYPGAGAPHQEGNTGPVNIYGMSKLLGEYEARAHKSTTILRTNFFGPSMTEGRSSFDDFIRNNLSQGITFTLFEDLLFSPLHMQTVAQIVLEMLIQGNIGTFNLGSNEGMSKAQFGLAVVEHLGATTENIELGYSTAHIERAPRAHDLRMNIGRIEHTLGRSMPRLAEEIEKIL